MATNPYFTNFDANRNEQSIVEDLIVESIQIQGFDAYYLPNKNDIGRDILYGEDPIKYFTTYYTIEMYLSNATEYMGDKEFFTKFGLEIKNNVNVIVSRRSFNKIVTSDSTHIVRPREGDLIYIPFMNGTGELYEIKFTNQNKDYFMLGRKYPYFYELELEKFKYSNEYILTSNPVVDDIMIKDAYTIDLNIDPTSGTGNYKIQEVVFQSLDNTYANLFAVATVQSFDANNSILSVSNIAGEFTPSNNPIIGLETLINYKLLNYDPLQNNAQNESSDNQYIDNQSNNIIDISTPNAFGKI
jgi:hypothetical protein